MQSMETESISHVPGWRRPVAVASACAILGLLIEAPRHRRRPATASGGHDRPRRGAGGASLLLSWAADAAEVELSGGLVLAGVTLVTVLPELVVEIHFAYTQQTELVSANLTGATRLLLTGAVAMPILAAWLLARRGQRAEAASYRLAPARRVDLAVLFVASLYGILLALLGRVSLIDGLLLIALYLFFLRRIGGTPDEPPAVVGVSASLADLPRSSVADGWWACLRFRQLWSRPWPFRSATRFSRRARGSASAPTCSSSRSCPPRPRRPNTWSPWRLRSIAGLARGSPYFSVPPLFSGRSPSAYSHGRSWRGAAERSCRWTPARRWR